MTIAPEDEWFSRPNCERRSRTAQFYRAKAEELRVCAEDSIQDPQLREQWAAMAVMYERLADQAEGIWNDEHD